MTVTAEGQSAGWRFTGTGRPLWLSFSVVRALRALAAGPLPEGRQTRAGRTIAAGAAPQLAQYGLANREPDSPRWQITTLGRAHLDAIDTAEVDQ